MQGPERIKKSILLNRRITIPTCPNYFYPWILRAAQSVIFFGHNRERWNIFSALAIIKIDIHFD